MAGRGDRRHRLALHRQSARPLSPRVGHEVDAAPVRGGSIAALRSFLNVQTEADFVLVVACALASAQPRSLSGDRAVARTGFGEVHLLGNFAGAVSGAWGPSPQKVVQSG
jgi:hypothetical protein